MENLSSNTTFESWFNMIPTTNNRINMGSQHCNTNNWYSFENNINNLYTPSNSASNGNTNLLEFSYYWNTSANDTIYTSETQSSADSSSTHQPLQSKRGPKLKMSVDNILNAKRAKQNMATQKSRLNKAQLLHDYTEKLTKLEQEKFDLNLRIRVLLKEKQIWEQTEQNLEDNLKKLQLQLSESQMFMLKNRK